MKDAEDSIKGIATSCTVVGALIVTIMFAAAFCVPGGSDSNTGLPIFMDKKLFKIFIVADGISLVFSTTSVIIFLGILTSRYAEDDFLTSLPTKMMIGLSTLFFSISTMMIAFSSALTVMIGDNGNSKTFIQNLLLAFLPITSFIWMQFSFIVEIFISTYGPGIFDKKIKPWR
ncbi:ankyrin repeat-containing protein ITN1-like [Rosa chinensis]|nr:ankyrin repeat-containing protein ITN1-like [Rosa chinensis]